MRNHTPKPWEVRGYAQVWAGGQRIIDCYPHGVHLSVGEANAHLIISAPTLLEQRDDLLQALEFVAEYGMRGQFPIVQATVRAAIAKVKGETP